METSISVSTGLSGKALRIKGLLICGILSSLLWVGADILAAMLYEGYSYTSQTISELSAIGAPTRPMLVRMGIVYSVLLMAFGFGVWESAGRKLTLRVTASLLVAHGLLALAAPFTSMHTREVLATGGGTTTDTMHLVLTGVTVLLILLTIGFGAAAFGKHFRIYSILTIVILLVFGGLTGLAAPRVEANLPTPWLGLFERTNGYGFMLWVVVLALTFLRGHSERPQAGGEASLEDDKVDGITGDDASPKMGGMRAIRAFIKNRPVISYYALTFAISWGGILLVVGGPGGLLGTSEQVEKLQVFALLALFAGPSMSGVLMNWIVCGKVGLRELWSRMLRWRVEGRWYAAALFLAPVLVIGILLSLSLISPEFTPRIFTESDKLTLLLFGIGWALLGGGLLEETGWTGFAVHALLKRYSIPTTGLIVGFLWGTWHFLIAFWVISSTSLEPLSLSIYLPALVFYVVSLPAYRVLMVWVYHRTGGSLLVAMLMHAVFSATMLIMEPMGIAVEYSLTFGLLLAASLWITVALVAVAHKGQLSPPLRERAA